MEKHLIVGIDPGTSVGIAFLDVDGEVVDVKSARNLPIEDIITEIASRGTAAVIASDKAVAPPAVAKVASITGARLFTPDEDLQVERKRELAARRPTGNDHERDSLAAAVYAYYHFQNKIRRIERQVLDELEAIKARVLKGEKVSDIFEMKEGGGKEKELLAQLSALRKENRELKTENDQLLRARPKSPHEIIRGATREAKDIMVRLSKGKLAILKEVPSLAFIDLKDAPIKQGDCILCRGKGFDTKGIKFLESRRVGAIISPAKLESIAPTGDLGELETISWEGLFFADPLEVQKKCGRRREVKARDLELMLVDYKKGRR